MKELQEIFARYREGKTNADETAFVNRYYEYFEKNALFSETLTENERSVIHDEKWQAMLQWINRQQQAPVHRVHFLRTAWFRYAAAIILIITGITLYYTVFHTSQSDKEMVQATPSPKPEADVLPGSDRAILTLSNGQQVQLNNATSETIKDGTLSIENINGQLSYKNAEVVAINTMSTPKGGQYQLTLADGTRVWLNAASSITYPTAFKGNSREVMITGEAYLEVAKNKEKPFIVRTAKDEITVLGTQFNVNAYADEPTTKTSLLEGSVRISPAETTGSAISPAGGSGAGGAEGGSRSARTATGIILTPGQAYSNGKVFQTNIEKDIAWKNGSFYFEGTSFLQIAKQLERWYDIEIKYVGNPPVVKLRGEMDMGVKLSGVCRFLNEVGIATEIKDKTLIISKASN